MMSEFEFDFDHWKNLAQRSPTAYFQERSRLIENFIASCPPEHAEKMREMQAQIDTIRACSGSPLQATRQMMAMMSEQLCALQSCWGELRHESMQLKQAMLEGARSV